VTDRRLSDALPVLAYAAGLFVLVVFIARFSTPLAFLDDLTQVRFLYPEAVLDWDWLWHQHNEHRIPLPRLIYTGLLLMFRDFRAPTWVDVALLAGFVWVLMEAARRIRGRRSAFDAFFPLLWLSLGPAENHLNGFQVVFFLPIGLAAVFLAVIAQSQFPLRPRTVAGLGTIVFLLPLCGVPGIIVALPLAAWLFLDGVTRLRATGRAERGGARIAVIASVLTLALIGATLIGFQFLPNPGRPGPLQVAATTLQALGQSAGWLNLHAWPYGGILALLLFLSGVAAAFRGWRHAGDQRRRALAIAAVLVAGLGLALAIGVGRGADQAHAGMLSRYGTLAMLWPTAAWFAFALWGSPQTRTVVQASALALAAACWFGNLGSAWKYGTDRRDAAEALVRESRGGTTWKELAEDHYAPFFWSPADFFVVLRDLERTGMPPFSRPGATLRAPTPFDSFLDAPDEVRHDAPPASRSWGNDGLTAMHPGSSLRWRLPDDVRHFGVRLGLPPYAGILEPSKPAQMSIWLESADGSKSRQLAEFELREGRGEPPFYGQDYEVRLPPATGRVLVLRVAKDSPRWGAWSYASLR